MRFSVPSVASEVQNVLTARAQLPSNRPADPDPRQAAIPFADFLDNTDTTTDPPPPPPAPRPTANDPSSASSAATDNGTTDTATPGQSDAKSGSTDADTTDATAPDAPATAAKGDANDKTDAAKAPSSQNKTKAATDEITTLEAMLDSAAPNATPPQTPVAAVIALNVNAGANPDATSDLDADALAALQSASSPAGQAKPASADGGNGPASPQAAAPAKTASATDPNTVPQIEGGDGRPRSNNEAVSGDFRAKLASLVADGNASGPATANGATASTPSASADAVQNSGLATPVSATNATAPTPATASTASLVTAAVPLTGLAVEIAKEASAGRNHFEIRLDPPELGRIDVRLSVDHDGRVSSHLTVDRPDTLDLLKRDANSLERALQQAGLKTSDNALEFSLRQQGYSGDDTPRSNTAQIIVPTDDPAPLEALRQGYGRLLGLGGGLDITV